MESIKPGPGWKGLAKELRGRTSVFIGMTDAGKTTLIRHLMGEILSEDEAVCLVDSDIGQSSLGLPGTVSAKTFRRPDDMGVFMPERMLFVGTTNPARKISRVVEAAERLVKAARASGVRTILVDTTGLVLGWPGRALKLAKIRAIGPDNVVAVEREDELKHIISELRDVEIHRLRASRFAKEKTRAARIRYRKERMRSYFADSETLRLRTSRVEFLSNGSAVDVGSVEPGILVALNKGEDTLGLGIYEGLEDNDVLVRTPLRQARGINRVLIGEITLY